MYTYLLINTRDQNTSIDVTENSNVITQFKIFHRTFVIFSRASQTEVMEEGCWKKLPSSVQILNPPVNNLLFRLSIGRSDRKYASVQRKYKLVQRGQECWLNYQSDVSVLALERMFLEIIEMYWDFHKVGLWKLVCGNKFHTPFESSTKYNFLTVGFLELGRTQKCNLNFWCLGSMYVVADYRFRGI